MAVKRPSQTLVVTHRWTQMIMAVSICDLKSLSWQSFLDIQRVLIWSCDFPWFVEIPRNDSRAGYLSHSQSRACSTPTNQKAETNYRLLRHLTRIVAWCEAWGPAKDVPLPYYRGHLGRREARSPWADLCSSSFCSSFQILHPFVTFTRINDDKCKWGQGTFVPEWFPT